MNIVVVAKERLNKFYLALSTEDIRVSFVPFTSSIDAFHNKSEDVVLLDCGHEGDNGLKWLTAFKKSIKNVPVILISSVRSYDIVMHAYKVGIRDYFTKPVSISELSRLIAELHSLKSISREERTSLPCTPPNKDCKMTNLMISDIPTIIACVVHYIEENISKSLTLSDIAGQANLSKFHFARIFKQLTGFSPLEFVIILKMHKAKKLLVEKDLPVSHVAEEVGYLDLRTFERRFKQHTGVTPSAYRKSFIT